jgi:hypothetical protein
MRRTLSGRAACGSALLLLLVVPLAHAQEVILQYDSFATGHAVSFQGGFVTGERAAVHFMPAGPFPKMITKVQFLFGGAVGTKTITLRIWRDTTGMAAPGTQIFSSGYVVVASDTEMQEIDLSGEAISVYGPFRVGIQFQHDGLPSIAQDQDATIYGGVHWIYWKLGPGSFTWYDWSMVGGQGDLIIRAGVAPNPDVLFADGFES